MTISTEPNCTLCTARTTARRQEDPGRAARTAAVDEEALALAHRIVELASDKKASDIVLLDVRAQTAMASRSGYADSSVTTNGSPRHAWR